MSCRLNNCKARSSKYKNGCMAVKDGCESFHCPFFKTYDQYKDEIRQLMFEGHPVCKTAEEYELLYEKHRNNQSSKG